MVIIWPLRLSKGNLIIPRYKTHKRYSEIIFDKDMMAVEVCFEKGAIGAMHSHPHVQISYVLEGKFEATIGDETKIIGVGDTYYTVPDIPHGVVCLEKGKLLDIFTPEREDFLK